MIRVSGLRGRSFNPSLGRCCPRTPQPGQGAGSLLAGTSCRLLNAPRGGRPHQGGPSGEGGWQEMWVHSTSSVCRTGAAPGPVQRQRPAPGQGLVPGGQEGSPSPALPGTACGRLPRCRTKWLSAREINP